MPTALGLPAMKLRSAVSREGRGLSCSWSPGKKGARGELQGTLPGIATHFLTPHQPGSFAGHLDASSRAARACEGWVWLLAPVASSALSGCTAPGPASPSRCREREWRQKSLCPPASSRPRRAAARPIKPCPLPMRQGRPAGSLAPSHHPPAPGDHHPVGPPLPPCWRQRFRSPRPA